MEKKKKIPDGITNFKGIVGHIENIFGHCHLTFQGIIAKKKKSTGIPAMKQHDERDINR